MDSADDVVVVVPVECAWVADSMPAMVVNQEEAKRLTCRVKNKHSLSFDNV